MKKTRFGFVLLTLTTAIFASGFDEAVSKFHAGELDSGKSILSALWKGGEENDSVAYFLGRIYFRQGDHDRAQEAIHRMKNDAFTIEDRKRD